MNKITANIINNNTKAVKGLKPLAYWCYRSEVTLTITNNVVSAVSTPILGVIQGCKFFMNGGSEIAVAEDNFSGYKQKLTAIINQSSKELDEMEDVVFFVQTNLGQWLCLGAEHGLWKASQAQMANENLATVAVEFATLEGREEKYSEHFVTADLSLIPNTINFDTIYGGTIENGGLVKLSIDTDKTGYIILPNGVVLTTVAGVINTTYTGITGHLTRYVPKNNVYYIKLNGSTTIGEITYTGNCPIELSVISGISGFISNTVNNIVGIGCPNLTKAVCPKSSYINLSECALTAKSIGDIIYSAYIDNRSLVVYDFSAGTNAIYNDIDSYINTISSVSLYDMLQVLRTNGGVISLNGEA